MTGWPITAAGTLGLVSKATLILAAALVLAWLARRGSARTAHMLWTTTFAMLLVLPGLSLLAPSWELPVLPARTAVMGHQLPVDLASGPSATTHPPDVGPRANSLPRFPTGPAPSPARANASVPITPAATLFLAWALGCGIGLVSLTTATLRFRKLARGATPIRDPDWIRSTVALRHRLRVRADPRILSSAHVRTPMAGGPLRPVILLPASAERWTAGRREVVISHELVHVRRRDALWRLVGGVVVALYWFHPLIWLASRLAATARERSCDEEVLALGVRPSAYARHLLSLASEIVPGPPVLSLPMAQRPHLERRIMSILTPRRPRFSSIRTLAALTVVGVVGVAAACARPVRMDPPASPPPQAETAQVAEPPTQDVAPSGSPASNPAAPPNSTPREPHASGTTVASATSVAPQPDRTPDEGDATSLPGRVPDQAVMAPDQVPPDHQATTSMAPTLVPEAVEPRELECRPGRFAGIMRDRGSTTVQVTMNGRFTGSIRGHGLTTVRTSMNGMSLCMRTSGTVAMTDDGTTITGVEPGGRLVLASREAARLHRLVVTSGPNGLAYEWSVDGRPRPFDTQAREWRDLILTVLARSREALEVRATENRLRGEIGSHERHVAGLRREIGHHERHVAGLRRQIGSHERHVAGLRRETEGHERHVASLRREIGSHERHVASLRRAIEAHERHIEGLRRGMAAVTWAGAREALARAEAEVRSVRQAIEEYDLDRQRGEIERRIRDYDLDGKIADLETQVDHYDLGGKIGSIETQIGQYDLQGKIADIEAQIEHYDLDGRIREVEARIEEWDAEGRAGDIERSIQEDAARLRRLIQAVRG